MELKPEIPIVSLHDTSLFYGGIRALNRVNIEIRPGEIHAVGGGTVPESLPWDTLSAV